MTGSDSIQTFYAPCVTIINKQRNITS